MGRMKDRVIEWMNTIGKDPLEANKEDYTLFTLMNFGRPRFTGKKDSDGNPIFTKENWVSIGDTRGVMTLSVRRFTSQVTTGWCRMKEGKVISLFLLSKGGGALDHKGFILQIGCVHNTFPSPPSKIKTRELSAIEGWSALSIIKSIKGGHTNGDEE